VTAAPTFDHQFVAAKLSRMLGSFVEDRDLGVVLFAPFDVNLPGLASPVQPDIVFIRSENQPRPGDKLFEGTPALIVEILSQGTGAVDREVKYAAYEAAGVQEYWLVSPITGHVFLYAQSDAGRGFSEVGQYGRGQTARSTLLPGFAVEVDQLFPRPRA
jgi:Uma2 family endonuclease